MDLRKAARERIDLSTLILDRYSDEALEFLEEFYSLNFFVTKSDLIEATKFLVSFLKKHNLEIDEEVVKWIYLNLKKLAKTVRLLRE